jgi:hypothetical protein
MRSTSKILVGKLEEKERLGKPGRRWEDNIKMDIEEKGERAWTRFKRLRLGVSGGLL